MDIDALKTFIEVSRTRHFGQSARNLYVSQSTVSARIKLLEERLGVPLFIRQRNNIQLTSAGQKLMHYAETIVTTWTRANQEIALDDEKLVPFTVGSTPSLWDAVLQDWMKFITAQNPETVLHAEVHDSVTLARLVQNLVMDMAFVFDNPQLTDIRSKEIAEIPFFMVSHQQGMSLQQALEKNYILVEWGNSFSVAHAKNFPNMPQPHMRIMLGRIALNYLLSGNGQAYIPEPMVREYLDRQQLFLVEQAPVIKRSVYALFSAENRQMDLIDTACNFFKQA